MRAPEKKFPNRRKKWILPDREWLEYEYCTLEKSAHQIAKEIGLNPGKLAEWLDKLKISRRSSSEAGILLSGSRSPFWKGPNSRSRGAVYRLVKELNLPETCNRCGMVRECMEIHHKDGNHHNNSQENLERLCRSCHRKHHWTEKNLGKESLNGNNESHSKQRSTSTEC